MDRATLLSSELECLIQTQYNLNGWYLFRKQFVDTLLELNDFLNFESEDENFQRFNFYAKQVYFHLPYTFEAWNQLLEKGYYLESASLLRNFFENLVKLTYFQSHPNELRRHLVAETSKNRVLFKTMFDAIFPGLYEHVYIKQLSEFTHGGLGSGLFRSRQIPPNKTAWIHGNLFSEFYSSYLVNLVTPVILIYVLKIPFFFPNFNSIVSNRLKDNLKDSKEWLLKAYNAQKTEFPKYMEYAKLMDKVINEGEIIWQK